MRGIRQIVTAANGAGRLCHRPPQTNSICIFCRLQVPQSRSISSTRRNAAVEDHNDVRAPKASRVDEEKVELESSSASADIVTDAQYDASKPTQTPEFDYEIVPDLSSAEPLVPLTAEEEKHKVNHEAMLVRSEEARMRREDRKDKIQRQQMELNEVHEKLKSDPTGYGYKPAETWKGLLRMGGEKIEADVPPFQGYFNRKPKQRQTQVEATVALYRAVVETFASAASGVADLRQAIDPEALKLPNATQSVRVEIGRAQDGDGHGPVRLHFPDADVERRVLGMKDAESGLDDVEEAPITDSSGEAMVKSWGRAWLHIPLDDPNIKFAIIKRLTYYLGRTISDHSIHKSSTVFTLLANIAEPDPPLTVFEALSRSEKPTRDLKGTQPVRDPQLDLLSMPNVKFMPRRSTTVDKEMALGRWKLVERELQARGLPVFNKRSNLRKRALANLD